MRVLLDTNIVIHRESRSATNYTIGNLFYWLDKLHYDKLIHPYTEMELRKANNAEQQDIYDARLSAYGKLRSIAQQSQEFIEALEGTPKTDNDEIDNQLLYEAYSGRVDILITEDRKMRKKAASLGIADKVFSINEFITKCSNENPGLIEYKTLSVKKELFGAINSRDPFFDTFRNDYVKFDAWFAKKCDEEAYVCRTDDNRIQGFLYLKVEDEKENYSDISPLMTPRKRLKVGTFKVESTGFRLGERFMKIIFDNAIEQGVEEIYVTLYSHREELGALRELFSRWGFELYGTKKHETNEELVLTKQLGFFDTKKTIKENFPNLPSSSDVRFLPIDAKYHTRLFPDSMLKSENEIDFLGKTPEKYALQKVYISFSFKRDMKPGDLLVIYRPGNPGEVKAFKSVITSLAVLDEIKFNFSSREEYLKYCENRTVFSANELNDLWEKKNGKLLVIKLIYIKTLSQKMTLGELWNKGIVQQGSGPRPFDYISKDDFDIILNESGTQLF